MISVDNMILFIFIIVCIFFGVGISAILRIFSRRHQQQNQDPDDPFISSDQQNRRRCVEEYPNRNSIFVIDIGNETFYKGPPPPKYDEELPPSYEEVLQNAGLRLPPMVTVTTTTPTPTVTPTISQTISPATTTTTVTTATATPVTSIAPVTDQSAIG